MRAFSLLELMAVVAIAGVLAAVAVPNLTTLSAGYRGREAARAALFAIAEGRNESQQINKAVRAEVFSDRIELSQPDTIVTAGLIARVATWKPLRTFKLGSTFTSVVAPSGTVTPTVGAAATTFFCPSSEASWLDDATGLPLCRLGDVASGGGVTTFKLSQGAALFQIELSPALAGFKLR
jgi:prepilin-type N-terminal cleavage/methylation domain-containing protein